MSHASCILMIGLGSPHGDDQIGWRIADEIQSSVTECANVRVRRATVPLDLVDWLEGVDRLHICDACAIDEPTGTVRRLESLSHDGHLELIETMEAWRTSGSHDFGLAAVLKLAARLNRLPMTIIVHLVSGGRFDAGAAMSDELGDCVPRVVESILEELTDARNIARVVATASG